MKFTISEERNAQLTVLLEKFDEETQRQMDEFVAAANKAKINKQFMVKLHNQLFDGMDLKGRPQVRDQLKKDQFIEAKNSEGFYVTIQWDLEDVYLDVGLDESGGKYELNERYLISHEAWLRNPKSALRGPIDKAEKRVGDWSMSLPQSRGFWDDKAESGESLVEYEIVVKAGWAYDDEGNREQVHNVEDGHYSMREWGDIMRHNRSRRRPTYGRGRSTQKSPADARKLKAIEQALEYQPKSKFLKSVRDQLNRGRQLSKKQRDVVRKILIDLGGTVSAKFFEEVEMKLDERRTGFVFPDREAWPIGDKKHALLAVSYMKAGKGDDADYAKIKKDIAAKYGKDQTVMSALKSIGEDSEVLDAAILCNLYPDYPIHEAKKKGQTKFAGAKSVRCKKCHQKQWMNPHEKNPKCVNCDEPME